MTTCYDSDEEEEDFPLLDSNENDDDKDEDEKATGYIKLRVKSFKDAHIDVNKSDTVASVKQAVVEALGPEAENRYLRLIFKGRLLAPDTARLQEFTGIRTGDVVHAVLAAAGQRGGAQAALASAASSNHHQQHQRRSALLTQRAFRGTGITANGVVARNNDNEDWDEDDSEDDVEQGRERLGFDRLRQTGLRRSEVAAIRAYFSRQVDRWARQNSERVALLTSRESDATRRRLLTEDAWMQAQGPTSEFRFNLASSSPWQSSLTTMRSNDTTPWRSGMSSSVGTDRDFMWGFLLGFFVGFLMLVWVWMPTVPHKQKLGILTGISFQLALSTLKGSDVEDIFED